ncbi:hypothetical protein K3177_09985 [Qipengyuania sp. GH25]|uniref:Uncharacterized protein n=1 Tax=Qipengyuania pacifica TaxID=2860199 RepID=A0ABS7JFP3_9SPHN|nr:hypothetical protein [Qipengyuania aerophila]MBX7488842.1 hypothetical protein [Qipengyuania aerophila]
MNSRDRAKVKAALAELRQLGHDPAQVTNIAGAMIRNGTPARKAYDTAFNKLVERQPSLHATMQRIGQFFEAADLSMVARSNVALDKYIATGDTAALKPVAEMAVQHLQTMAVKTGDAGFADGLPDMPAPAASKGRSRIERPDRPGWPEIGFQPSAARQAAPAQSNQAE